MVALRVSAASVIEPRALRLVSLRTNRGSETPCRAQVARALSFQHHIRIENLLKYRCMKSYAILCWPKVKIKTLKNVMCFQRTNTLEEEIIIVLS